MKIECNWSRNDLKKYLHRQRRIPNIILLVLGIYFFYYITYYAYSDIFVDKTVLLLGFAIYVLLFIVLLWVATKIYVFVKLRRNDKKTSKAYGTYRIEIDKNKIVSIIGDEKISYEWKEISYSKFRKNYFFLATKRDKIGLVFRREILRDDYNPLREKVKKYLKENS